MRSVSARLTLLFVGLIMILLAGFSVSLYFWVRRGLLHDLDRELEQTSRMFQERFVEEYAEVGRGVHPSLDPELDSFLAVSGARAEVRDAKGTILFPASTPYAISPGHRELTSRFDPGDGRLFKVRLALDTAPYLEPLRQLEIYFAIFVPIVLGLTWILGLAFVRHALSPVEAIRRHAERISRANVSERVPVPRTTGEIRDLAVTFNDMLDRLDRAFQDLQSLAGDAAHELRTPLANLRAEIETAVQEERTSEEYERILLSFSEEIARMSAIVTDLLMLAQMDMRRHALRKEPVELTPVLEEVRETWQAMAAERDIEIRTEGEPLVVAADPVAIRRVFMNLVENAVKYNRDGGRVTLSTERRDGKGQIQVADTGPGIAAEHLPRLFRRFTRVDEGRARETGGAGLGLAICKSFIEAHEGSIEVRSTPGEGTVFTVVLPLSDRPGQPTPAPQRTAAAGR